VITALVLVTACCTVSCCAVLCIRVQDVHSLSDDDNWLSVDHACALSKGVVPDCDRDESPPSYADVIADASCCCASTKVQTMH
jgi:hypothetical protein